MAIILNDNIRVNAPKPQEDKRMNNGVPYTDVAQANSLLNPVVDRYESLEVVIGTPSNWSIYWYKNGVADTDLILKEEGGAGLELWDVDKEYLKAQSVLYEDPIGYFSIYVAKQDNIGQNPTTSTANWGIANDGAFVPIEGNASIKDTKSFENVQVEDNLNFTAIETGIGIHYIVDGVNNVLRLNKFPSGDPLDIDNDIIRYFSVLEEMAIRWKLKLESVALGDDNDEVLLIGSNGEVKKIAFSDISVDTTDTPLQDSEQPFNAGGAYILKNNIDTHKANTSNPHNVTKNQVGLGNVPNVDTTDPANISQSSTYRFTTDTEKSTWSGKLSTDFSNITGVPTNTGNVYSVTVPATVPSPPLNGQPILFKPQAANTGAATLAVNGGTAYPINKGVTTALASGDLQAGKSYMLHFNTANNSWQILGELRNDNILNQTASSQAGGFYTGTGRLDTGLGLGITPNLGAFETVAAATSAKAQLLLTQGTVDYTGTTNGMLWNNAGEIKFLDNSIVNRIS